MTTYYVGLFLLPLGDAVTLGLVSPPITALLAHAVLHEPLGWQGVVGCGVSLNGVVVLARPPFLFGGATAAAAYSPLIVLGTAATVTSAVLASGSSICIRLIGKSEPATVVSLWFHTGTLMLSSFPLAIGWPQKAVMPIPGDLLLLFGVAATSFVAQILVTRGLQMCAAAKAAAMGFTQVLYSYSLGAIFFGEVVTVLQLLGVLLILLGVALVTVPRGEALPSEAAAAATAGRISEGTSYSCIAHRDDMDIADDLNLVHVAVQLGKAGRGKGEMSTKLAAVPAIHTEEQALLGEEHPLEKLDRRASLAPALASQLGSLPGDFPHQPALPAVTPSTADVLSATTAEGQLSVGLDAGNIPVAATQGEPASKLNHVLKVQWAEVGTTTCQNHMLSKADIDKQHQLGGQQAPGGPDMAVAYPTSAGIPSGSFLASPFSHAPCHESYWAATIAEMAKISGTAAACGPELCPAAATAEAISTAVSLHRSASLRSRSTSKTLSRMVSVSGVWVYVGSGQEEGTRGSGVTNSTTSIGEVMVVGETSSTTSRAAASLTS